jgi:hypothetical protein
MSGAALVGALAAQPGLGCVLPADLEPAGADAGPSAPPVILSVTPADAFSPPGPIVVSRESSPEMGLRARDIDLNDFLYVRLFVDYKQPPDFAARPGRADCQLAPTGTAIRVITCETTALCTDIEEDDTSDHVLEAMISDSPFILGGDPLAMGQPEFRAVAEPTRAGYSFLSWVMRCQPAQ